MGKIKTGKGSKGLPSTNIPKYERRLKVAKKHFSSTKDKNPDGISDQILSNANPEIDPYGNPSTPIEQTSISGEESAFNTPLFTKISQVEGRMNQYGATEVLTKGIRFTILPLFIGNKIVNSTPVRDSFNKTTSPSSPNSAKLIANIKEMRENQENGENWSVKRLSFKSPNISSITFVSRTNEENIPTTILNVTYKSGSRAVKVPKLGTYSDIADKLSNLSKANKYTDIMISEAIRKLSKNQPLEEPIKSNQPVADMLSHLTTLLFVVEVDRSCGSNLTANMFLDLVESGKYTFKQLPKLLPMAMKGAMKASKTLDKLLFSPLFKGYTSYDESGKSLEINHEVVKELVTRNKKIFEDWITCKGHNLDEITSEVYVQEIMQSMHRWFNFDLRPFRMHEEDEISTFTRDVASKEPVIYSDADYSILEDKEFSPASDIDAKQAMMLRCIELISFLNEDDNFKSNEKGDMEDGMCYYGVTLEIHDYFNPEVLGNIGVPWVVAL